MRWVLAAVILLFGAATAIAWDSKCFTAPAVECKPGPETARFRWIDPLKLDEHRRIWELSAKLASLPASATEAFTLRVFTPDKQTDAPSSFPTLQPADFTVD